MRDLYEFLFEGIWEIGFRLNLWRFVLTLSVTAIAAVVLHGHLADTTASHVIIAGVCVGGVIFGLIWEGNA